MSRIPPHDLNAERAVLGGMILQNKAIDVVAAIVLPGDYYAAANELVSDAILRLHAAQTPVDEIMLRSEMDRAGTLAAAGGHEYIMALTDTIPVIENIRSHARVIAEKAMVRRLVDAMLSQAGKGFADYGTGDEFIEQTERMIFALCTKAARREARWLRELSIDMIEEISFAAKSDQRISGLTTGFAALDALTSGMHPGDLIIVAGRPGMGKTSLALNVAVNASYARVKRGQPAGVAIFSLEMPANQLAKRIAVSDARVDSGRLRTGKLTNDDWCAIAQSVSSTSELPIKIDDSPSISLVELKSRSRRMMSEHGLCLIVIDYLQLMRAGSKTDNREQEISTISRGLKALAKELEIPVIALSQLNRGVESRANKDKRPQLSDLRESGAIEQDADTIVFVYRDEVYNKESEAAGIAEIIVGKQRSGPTGTVRLRYAAEYTRFDNLTEHHEES